MAQLAIDRGFVVSRRPLRESDLLCDLLCYEHGKISVVARSARKSKRRFSGLDYFRLLEFSIVPSTRDLWTLSDATIVRDFGLADDLLLSAVAAYGTECCSRFAPQRQQDEALVMALAAFYENLHAGDAVWPPLVTLQLQILSSAGLLGGVEVCAGCGGAFEGSGFAVVSQAGIVCERCESKVFDKTTRVGPGVLRALALQQGAACRSAAAVLGRFIAHHLGAEPKSQAWLRHVASLESPA